MQTMVAITSASERAYRATAFTRSRSVMLGAIAVPSALGSGASSMPGRRRASEDAGLAHVRAADRHCRPVGTHAERSAALSSLRPPTSPPGDGPDDALGERVARFTS